MLFSLDSTQVYFLTPARLQGSVNKFPGGARPYAPYNMRNLIVKLTNNCIYFYSFFRPGGIETKNNYFFFRLSESTARPT